MSASNGSRWEAFDLLNSHLLCGTPEAVKNSIRPCYSTCVSHNTFVSACFELRMVCSSYVSVCFCPRLRKPRQCWTQKGHVTNAQKMTWPCPCEWHARKQRCVNVGVNVLQPFLDLTQAVLANSPTQEAEEEHVRAEQEAELRHMNLVYHFYHCHLLTCSSIDPHRKQKKSKFVQSKRQQNCKN